jgi:hypothetical protein
MKMLEKKRSVEGKKKRVKTKIDHAEEQKLRCIIVSIIAKQWN